MRIVALSDSHCMHNKLIVPEGDIIVHGGDALSRGDLHEFEQFISWYGSLPFKEKLYTPGNHDWLTYRTPSIAKQMCEDHGIKMLIDEEITIEGIRMHFTPWSPSFCGWAWMREDHEAESPDGEEGLGRYTDMIPEGLDVLVSHAPPYGYLDIVPGNRRVGSQELYKAILRTKPKLVLVGHIHIGQEQGDGSGNDYIYHEDGKVTHIANISVLNGSYRPSRQPLIFEF